jgi:hypothetical protein
MGGNAWLKPGAYMVALGRHGTDFSIVPQRTLWLAVLRRTGPARIVSIHSCPPYSGSEFGSLEY